jgi:glycosyltransferase involved in cell wall biosynthesis
MITVAVCARNDEATIAPCLRSLEGQECRGGFELVVIDDASTDRTARIVERNFPRYALFREPRHVGWAELVRRRLPGFRGDVVAFLGSHAEAEPGWLAAVEHEMRRSSQIVTGFGSHGRDHLLERFEALSVHADYLGREEREVPFVWDDNFAIRRDLLGPALPQTDVILSDGVAGMFLSRRLRDAGLPIHYRPSMKIRHATNSLAEIFRIWYRDMATNAVLMRRVDRSIPGARLLWTGPVAAALITAGRFAHGARTFFAARRTLHASRAEAAFHGALLACLMPGYFVGLCRAMFRKSPRRGTERAG